MLRAYQPNQRFCTLFTLSQVSKFDSFDALRMIKLLAFLSILVSALSPRPVEIWAEPIPYFETESSTSYQAPVTKYGSGHRGIDFVIPLDAKISSPQDGQVHFVGQVVDRDVVTVKTRSGYLASFEPVCSDLAPGTSVQAGQVIGTHCQAKPEYQSHCQSCVHFSARSRFGYISPLYLMGKTTAAILTG